MTPFASSAFAIPSLWAFTVSDLPTVNALLNATATVLLVVGYALIKRGQEQAHKRTMMAAFVVSILFLACYLTYHYQAARKVHRP